MLTIPMKSLICGVALLSGAFAVFAEPAPFPDVPEEAYAQVLQDFTTRGFRALHQMTASQNDSSGIHIQEFWFDLTTREYKQEIRTFSAEESAGKSLDNLVELLKAKPRNAVWRTVHGTMIYSPSKEKWEASPSQREISFVQFFKHLRKDWYLSAFAPPGEQGLPNYNRMLDMMNRAPNAISIRESDGLIDEIQLRGKEKLAMRVINEYLQESPLIVDEPTAVWLREKVEMFQRGVPLELPKAPTSGSGLGIRLRYSDRGMYVDGIFLNSPAAASGMVEGDQILSVNGVAFDFADKAAVTEMTSSKTAVTLEMKRKDGSTYSVTINKAPWPAKAAEE